VQLLAKRQPTMRSTDRCVRDQSLSSPLVAKRVSGRLTASALHSLCAGRCCPAPSVRSASVLSGCFACFRWWSYVAWRECLIAGVDGELVEALWSSPGLKDT
jgi:hypothetical protein